MKAANNFQNSQLEAINKFYNRLIEQDGKEVSMTEAIITWFAEGYAEQFRDEYLRKHLMKLH